MSHNEEILVPILYLSRVSYLQTTHFGGVIRTREFLSGGGEAHNRRSRQRSNER